MTPASSHRAVRTERNETLLRRTRREIRDVCVRVRLGHPVSLAHFTCTLSSLSIVCDVLARDDAPRRARSFALPHIPSGRVARRISGSWPFHSTSVSTPSQPCFHGERGGRCSQFVGEEPSGSGRFPSSPSGSVVFPQCCGRCCGACGTAAPGIGWPRTLFGASGARGYTDTPVHLAPLDVGALALPPRGFQPRGLRELVGPSFACEIVQRPSAKLPPKAAQVEAQRGSGLSLGYVAPCAGKCRP